ncbi:MAG: hypothetical protein GWO24_00215, partial [Akkermansiaceae bacterium]|nr:hypothetical protein [Akkermansiaceae bacterium]
KAAGTDPKDADSDGDGLSDGDEVNGTLNRFTGVFTGGALPNPPGDPTDPLDKDTDGDGLSDKFEIDNDTNPALADTDGGGVDDGGDPEPLDPGFECTTPTQIIVGEVIEFTSPDDLLLDPALAVIAVDVFGDVDKEVNGVTFRADGRTPGMGTAEEGPVTVTTTAPNQIPNWAAPPAFSGGQGDSASNLAQVMASIRWNAAPNPVTVLVEGLNPNEDYHVQLLVNEGRRRVRSWDISVNDELVIDNFSSEGLGGGPASGCSIYTGGNSFAYAGVFTASGDGILEIINQEQIGGDPPIAGTDHNPILQGVIIHRAAQPIPIALNVESADDNLVLSWNSKAGKVYDILSSTDLSAETATWPVFEGLENIPAAPPRNTEIFARPGDEQRWFVVLEKDAPPFFSEDFESGAGEWTQGVNDANGNTNWELGTPSAVGPVSGAGGSANCYGTNLSDDYGF